MYVGFTVKILCLGLLELIFSWCEYFSNFSWNQNYFFLVLFTSRVFFFLLYLLYFWIIHFCFLKVKTIWGNKLREIFFQCYFYQKVSFDPRQWSKKKCWLSVEAEMLLKVLPKRYKPKMRSQYVGWFQIRKKRAT